MLEVGTGRDFMLSVFLTDVGGALHTHARARALSLAHTHTISLSLSHTHTLTHAILTVSSDYYDVS